MTVPKTATPTRNAGTRAYYDREQQVEHAHGRREQRPHDRTAEQAGE